MVSSQKTSRCEIFLFLLVSILTMFFAVKVFADQVKIIRLDDKTKRLIIRDIVCYPINKYKDFISHT